MTASDTPAGAAPDAIAEAVNGVDLFPYGPVHLTTMSHYSLGEGAATIDDVVNRAKAIGAQRLGLMDVIMSGALEFAMACKKAGIKPILGMRVPMMVSDDPDQRYSIGLIAMDATGWRNLCRIHAASQALNPKTAALTLGDLKNLTEGTALLTGPAADGLGRRLAGLDRKTAVRALGGLINAWGDRLYIEIERPIRDPGQAEWQSTLVDLAYEHDVRILGSTDIRYDIDVNHGRWSVLQANLHNRVVSISEARAEVAAHRAALAAGKPPPAPALRHMRNGNELAALFADLPEALLGAADLSDRADYAPQPGPAVLPEWPDIEPGETVDDILRAQARAGLARLEVSTGVQRIPEDKREEYHARLEYELDVICRMKFPGYFLMVADFLGWARAQGIPIGPGRGSGAGSMVAWALGITDVDPLRYGLLFERFLNPDRVSMPDFDIDICVSRRGEVIDYIRGRYGDAQVAQIATFTGMRGRGAFKMAARVVTNGTGETLPYTTADELAKTLADTASGDGRKLKEMIEESSLFSQTLREETELHDTLLANGVQRHHRILDDVVKNAIMLQGVYAAAGQHAAGLVISPTPLADNVPLIRNTHGALICGYDMKYAEKSGLVKFDLLGLAGMTVLQETVNLVRKRVPDFDLDQIPVDDEPTLERFRQGHTSGVFQFESAFMRGIMTEMQPTAFTDLAAANALGRPGPMAYIPNYANRKHGVEKFTYYEPVEKTRPILEETYGIMVYQEQVMQIVQVCAGYSLAAADMMRRAMGKKIRAEMDKHKKIFIEGDPELNIPGALAKGLSRPQAERIFADIETFAEYGFNKSHSVAYALIGYRTMWLKTHYPTEFMAASLSMEVDTTKDAAADAVPAVDADGKKKNKNKAKKRADKVNTLLRECHDLGISLEPPDINEGELGFSIVEPGRLRFALGLGKKITALPEAFLQARAEAKFTSIADFHQRCGKAFRKDQLDSLVAMGAFDRLQPNRAMAAHELNLRHKFKPTKKRPEFDAVIEEMPDWLDGPAREHATCGTYVTRHPIDKMVHRLHRAGVHEMEAVDAWAAETGAGETGEARRICCMVSECVQLTTRKGKRTPYLLVRIAGRRSEKKVTMFSNDATADKFAEIKRTLEECAKAHQPVVMSVVLGHYGGKIRAAVSAAEYLQHVESRDVFTGRLVCHDRDEAARRLDEICVSAATVRADHDEDGRAVKIVVVIDGTAYAEMLPGRYRLTDPVFRYEVEAKFDSIDTLPLEPPDWVREEIMAGTWRAEHAAEATVTPDTDDDDGVPTAPRHGLSRRGVPGSLRRPPGTLPRPTGATAGNGATPAAAGSTPGVASPGAGSRFTRPPAPEPDEDEDAADYAAAPAA